MILLIDNYDSFTFNLYHFLGDLGAEIEVRRNDALTRQEALALRPEAIVLSPGPCTPNEAGICLDLIGAAARPACRCSASASATRRSARPSAAPWCARRSRCTARSGTSITAAPTSSPACPPVPGHPLPFPGGAAGGPAAELETTAWTEDGLVMGLAHRDLPIWGVQFHPESIASQHGHDLLRQFPDAWPRPRGRRDRRSAA